MNQAGQWAYPAAPRVEARPLIRNVYLWMTIGLLVTTAVAYITANSSALLGLRSSPVATFGAIIVELILVGVLSAAVMRLSAGAAISLFLVYAALNGFSLSILVLYYDLGTLTLAFAATALMFGAMTIVGMVTRLDLTRLGAYLFMALIGLVIVMVVNLFVRSSGFDLVISWIGVLIFAGLTAYDTQKIVRLASDPRIEADGTQLLTKLSILGALSLYLDFLNIFLFLLRILGRNRN